MEVLRAGVPGTPVPEGIPPVKCCCQWRSVLKFKLCTNSAASEPMGVPWAMFLWIIFISKYEILSKQHLKLMSLPWQRWLSGTLM